MQKKIKNIIKNKVLIIDGALGTELQKMQISKESWRDENGNDCEGCNELLNQTEPKLVSKVYESYINAGANLITTNTFGAIPWVLDEYNLGEKSYELSYLGAKLARELCDKYNLEKNPLFVLGGLGPGTKLPSLGHIGYDEMFEGYKIQAKGLFDAGVDIFLIETCQDPLQIKAAIHALDEIAPQIPIMVSVTIELNGTMLIGTDVTTIAAILEPFNILSLGINCGTGPVQIQKHVKTLSEVSPFPISVHSNAGLPQNKGGKTFYPMLPDEFARLQKEFLQYDGVAFLGGCCGTTPEHISTLAKEVRAVKPKKPSGKMEPSLASLFMTQSLKQNPAPLFIGERSNATGSKAFRDLLKENNYEGTLSVAQEQLRSGAHILDVSVGFAGRDEREDMQKIISLYSQKISLPLMPDSTQTKALEIALKQIGGKPIINSVNLEDGEEKFDEVCALAKKFGASLVCLAIDENGMGKTAQRKIEIAKRIYERATKIHKINPSNLVFDMLVFTLGSGDEEYKNAAIETISAIKEFSKLYPECGTTLGLSNISFGLSANSRIYLNSIFLHHCVSAGLSSAIVNVKHLIPINKIDEVDKEIAENLLFNKDENALFKFIEHFSNKDEVLVKNDEEFDKLNNEQKIKKLLIDGEKDRLITLANQVKDEVNPEIIVNDWLIEAMKTVGELFGNGQMQLPFVLQSAETMKACVDFLNPYLLKKEKQSATTLVLGTVKGDVHDVGKNLVDIILSNNGFKVVNIGIKADITQFIEAYKEYKPQAIGMSGLLVKSTQVMKENLEVLKQEGINVPIMLGGAALSKSFVDDYCRSVYDGPIFYCRDAFDSVLTMQRVEKKDFNTILPGDEIATNKKEKIKLEEKVTIKSEDVVMPKKEKLIIPPFWGRKVFTEKEMPKELAFEWLNHRVLFSQRWGYKRKNLKTEEFRKQEKEIIWPTYERLKLEFLNKNIFDPIVMYAYYPCVAKDNKLYVFDVDFAYNSAKEAKNIPPLQEAIKVFEFPRQKKKPHRAISDFFANDRLDVVGFSLASSGLYISEYEKKLYDAGSFQEYHHVHGLGVELAEALAEIVHKQIRLDLNLLENEGNTLKDIEMKSYVGCRYSPGYAACPDLEQNRLIFDLLKPEEFGISLSETFQMDPEQTTCAIIVSNKEAKYYNIKI